jgi:hypothetical protein
MKLMDKKEKKLKGELCAIESQNHLLLKKEALLKEDEEKCFLKMLLAQKQREFHLYKESERKLEEIKKEQEELPKVKSELIRKRVLLNKKITALSIEKKKWEQIQLKAYEKWCKDQIRLEESCFE